MTRSNSNCENLTEISHKMQAAAADESEIEATTTAATATEEARTVEDLPRSWLCSTLFFLSLSLSLFAAKVHPYPLGITASVRLASRIRNSHLFPTFPPLSRKE